MRVASFMMEWIVTRERSRAFCKRPWRRVTSRRDERGNRMLEREKGGAYLWRVAAGLFRPHKDD